MKVLLDTHALIWAVDSPNLLGPNAATVLRDPSNDLVVSAASVWEIGIKVGIGKLTLSNAFAAWCHIALADLNAAFLPIAIGHVEVVTRMPKYHGDPFDRMLIAQAESESIAVVSQDKILDRYGVSRIW